MRSRGWLYCRDLSECETRIPCVAWLWRGIAVALASTSCAVAIASCGGSANATSSPRPSTTSSPPSHATFAPYGAKVGRCGKQITGQHSSQGSCTFAYQQLPLKRCAGGSGGSGVIVSGTSCTTGRQLRLPVEGAYYRPAAKAGGVRQNVYRPWLAAGSFTNPLPKRPLGWTCFKHFDPQGSEGIRYVCWNSHGGIVLFTFS